jgi:hypothetical protein
MFGMLVAQLLVLLIVANGTPLIARMILGDALAPPLDGGKRFMDGRPVFGTSKTLRGVALSILGTSAVASLIGLGWKFGALIGGMAMIGDLLSSFIKRRLGLPPSRQTVWLDQIPESLLPLLASSLVLPLTIIDITVAMVLFLCGGVAFYYLLSKWHVRN